MRDDRLTVGEVAERVGLPAYAVQVLIAAGKVAASWTGGEPRLSMRELDAVCVLSPRAAGD